MANLFCYLRILIVKTAINQTFNQLLNYNLSYVNGIEQISERILRFLSLHILVFLVNSRGLRFFDTELLHNINPLRPPPPYGVGESG